MKSQLILAASLALAFAAPAFAQDSQTPPASPAGDQSAPADSQATGSDSQQPAPRKKRHHRTMQYQSGQGGYNPAAERLTGNEPGTAAYQASSFDKYKGLSVDHGHVHGDPPIIDHSGDHATVAPTTTTITVPPTH